jgi:pimeloyl-ACP methyl ester carboxylesterase
LIDLADDGFVDIGGGAIHYRLTPAIDEFAAQLPPLVFLHEGLGSLALWRTFPDDVRAALGGPTTLVYSRHGYGRSSLASQPRTPQYMHHEARHILPELLAHFAISEPVLVGHSDGASIAIIHAGSGFAVQGLVLMAPHVFVEERSLAGASDAKVNFAEGGLRDRMARHHDDAESTFRGWNDAWLSAEFRDWNIESFVLGITVATLLIQGDDDQYGTKAQVESIANSVGGSSHTLMLPGVGHAPHQESPEATRSAITEFLQPLYT